MANAFNLTAQLNLRGPTNIRPIIGQLRRELGSLKADIKINIDKSAVKSVDSIRGRVDALNKSLVLSQNNVKNLTTLFRDLSSSLSSTKGLNIGGGKSLETTASAAKAASKSLRESTTVIEEFGQKSALAFKRFAAYTVVTSGVFALVNAINSGIKAFIDFDKTIIQLKQVTGSGAVGIASLEKEITRLATSLGVSSASLSQVAITLAQAGLSAEQTRAALSALAKTELAPSFDSLTETTEGAIAALRQFSLETTDLESALGSINAVAAKFAVESSDIIAAIQRTGGVFASASKGVSQGKDALNEFIAVFTSVRATTRESAETIATGLRTIFTRIQRAGTIEQLKEFGVNLQDLEGKFVGPFEAVRRLSEALNQLDPRDIRFATIVEELGGFRQIGKVIPLIQQFATAQEALKVAQQGAGSLTEAQVIAQQSLANQIAKVREQFLALIRDVGKSTTFQVITKTVLTLTSGLISLAGAFKPILPILGILGAIKGISAISQFASGFFGLAGKGGGGPDTGDGGNAVAQAERDRAEATSRAADVIRENTTAITSLTGAVQSLENTIKSKPTGMNSGGKVMAFARGGVVPGSGNRDTVPAMLQPGEFVIRKKAVETIGAGNLQNMNRYADGGYIKKKIPGAEQKLKEQSISYGNISDLKINDSGKGAIRGYMFENYVGKEYGLDAPDQKFPDIPKLTNTLKTQFGLTKAETGKNITSAELKYRSGLEPNFNEQYTSDNTAVLYALERNSGGIIKKFAVGGRALGARSKFRELSEEDIAKLSTADLISYAKAQAYDVFSTGGAGIAVGSEFIEVPPERIVPELESSLVTYLGKRGFWREKVAPFGRPVLSQNKSATIADRASALEKQISRQSDEVAARSQNWTAIRSGSDIDNYLLSSLQDPILSDYRTVRSGSSLSKPFHDTRLRKAVNNALDQYDNFDYSSTNIDKLVSGMAAKRFAYGGFVQKFVDGAAVQSAGSISEDILRRIDELGGPGPIREAVGLDYINQTIRSKLAGRVITSKQLLSPKSLRSIPNSATLLPAIEPILERAELKKTTKATERQNQIARNLQAAAGGAYRFGLASIFGPKGEFGYSDISDAIEIEGKDGEKYLTQIIQKSLPTRYESVIQKIRERLMSVPQIGAEELQYADIFGTGGPLAFDFDETLVDGADILGRKFSDYNDLQKVKDALSNAELTLLGEELKQRINQYPELLNNIRVLTARPQSNAPYLADALARLQLPIPESKITGVSGGLNKVNNLSELETLIDDNIENIESVLSGGKKALRYQQAKAVNLTDKSSAKSISVMEGYALEEMVKSLGVPISADDADPNRPIDFPNGLGTSARYWDMPPTIPTDTKRTNSSSAVGRLFKEAKRFYLEKFANGGEAGKKQRNFGQIALRVGDRIQATYMKQGMDILTQGLEMRSGQVIADKIGANLYAVQSSAATKGYGPKLYDIVMEAVTEQGAMLTSDRKSVSEDARRIWEYYFNNRSDVQKTPLDPSSWTVNSKLIDPKLYGKSDSWPPYNDPAWILQTGYSKNPSDINNTNLVQRLATGGSVQDTVPALLTPGEFVINKNAAQKIGYGQLNKLNKADKIQGFNRGGPVGIQAFKYGGGVLPSDTDRTLKKLGDVLRTVQTTGNTGATDRLEEIIANVALGTTKGSEAMLEVAQIISTLSQLTERTNQDQTDTLNNIFNAIKATGDYATGISEKQLQAVEKLANTKGVQIVGQFPPPSPQSPQSSGLSKEDILAGVEQDRQAAMERIAQAAFAAGKGLEEFINDLDKFYNTVKEGQIAKMQDAVGGPLSSTQVRQATLSASTALPPGLSGDFIINDFESLSSAIKEEIQTRKESARVAKEEQDALEKAAEKYKNSGEAFDEFGAVGVAFPAQAQAFKNRKLFGQETGGKLLSRAQAIQRGPKYLAGFEKALERLPGPIGNAVRAIGGLPGVLSVVASAIGSNLLPELGKFLGLAQSPVFAGVSGALAEGGTMAASMGTIGQQLAGPIGGLIGTIGGAISGGISGFFSGLRTKTLENSLNALGKSSDLAEKSLENLSKVDTPENANKASKAVGNLQKNIEELNYQSQITAGEVTARTAAGGISGATYGGIAATGLLTATGAASAAAAVPAIASAVPAIAAIGTALAPLSAGASLAIAAGIIAIGTAIGAASSFFSGPDQLDNEALKGQLDAIGEYIEGINKLGQRRLNMTGAEEVGKFLEDLKNASTEAERFAVGARTTRVQEAQRAALQRANIPIDDLQSVEEVTSANQNAAAIAKVAEERYYEQLALDELNRIYKGNVDVIKQESKNKQKLIERGKQLNVEQGKLEATQRSLALAATQVQRAFEGLNEVFDNIDARLKRFSEESTQYIEDLENEVANLTGQGTLRNVNRETERILSNPLAYTEAEVRQAGMAVSGLAGGGEEGKALSDFINAQKILTEKLPALLRGMSSETAPTEAIRTIEQLLQASGIDPNSPLFKEALDQIAKSIQQSTQGKQGTSINETAAKEIVGNISNIIERGSQTGLKIVTEYNNALQRSIDSLNKYNQYLSKATEFERKAQQIRLQSDLDLQKALGNVPTLEQMNAPFETNIRSMTSGLMGPGGSMDPQAIAQAIIQSQASSAQRQEALSLNERRAAQLGGPATQAGRDQIARNDAERKAILDETRARNDATQALETLANSGELASNALNALQERQRKITGYTNFIDKLITAEPEQRSQILQEQTAANMVISGTAGNMYQSTQFRQLAASGLGDLREVMDPAEFRKVMAKFRLESLQAAGVDVDKPSGLLGKSIRQVLEEAMTGGADTPEAKAFKDAAAAQSAAAQAMADVNRVAAEKFLEGANTLEQFFKTEFQDIVRDSFGKVRQAEEESRTATTRALSQPQAISQTESALKAAQDRAAASEKEAKRAQKAAEEFSSGPGSGMAKRMAENASAQAQADKAEVNRLQKQVEAERQVAADTAARAQVEAKAAKEAQLAVQQQADLQAPPPSARLTGPTPSVTDNQQQTANNLNIASTSLATSAQNLETTTTEMRMSGGTSGTPGNLPSVRATAASSANMEEVQQQLLIKVDDTTRTFLTDFNSSLSSTLSTFGREFGSYVARLEKIKLPDTINMNGKHVVDVRITGAAGFDKLSGEFKNMISAAVKEKMALIWRQSDGAYGERPV